MKNTNFSDYIINDLRAANNKQQRITKIMENSVIVTIENSNKWLDIIDWLRENIRNISPFKTREYSTAWWLIIPQSKNGIQECKYIGVGFKNKDDALLFKLSGVYNGSP